LSVDESGRLLTRYRHLGTFEVDFAEAAASFLANDGIDEIWLRAGPSSKGPAALYEALATLEKRVFVPIVAWAPVQSAADARLLLSFGADRVVVDVSRGLPDPLAFVSRMVEVTGPDRLCCAVPVQRRAVDAGVGYELVDSAQASTRTPVSLSGRASKAATPTSIMGSTAGGGTGLDALALAFRLPDAGASEVLLYSAHPQSKERRLHDGELIEKVSATLTTPLLSFADDQEAADLATPLMMGADGVVTTLLSHGDPSAAQLHDRLREYGIPLRR
jgi:imidazole glycerol phosphate synthase subunit HisF